MWHRLAMEYPICRCRNYMRMIRILISGGCLVGVGILLAFIEIKIAGLYKKYCWDDYHNVDTRKYGNSNLFRRLNKDNITSQSTETMLLVGNICRDKMV